MGQVIQLPNGQTAQIIDGPGMNMQQGYASDMYLPSFPQVASQVEQHAKRIPWWAWALAGAYVAHRYLRR